MSRPTLQDFVEDEMLRAPLAFDQVIDTVHERWRVALGVQGRHGSDMARMLQSHRADLVHDALAYLRKQVQSEIAGAAPLTPPAAVNPARERKLELSLIDDDSVAVDIELARSVERIRSTAEFELRELQAFTSALVDDVNVSRDTNPFRPEGYVRALWQGVQTLPASRAVQAAFLRDAAEPLARTLRQGYAAACSRLEEQGIEPATHRTIVVAGSTTRAGREFGASTTAHELLHGLRDSMPGTLDSASSKLDATPAAPAAEAASAPSTPPSTPPRAEQQLSELVARLFEAMQHDHSVPAPAQALLQRLAPAALRVALHDPAMLDAYDHPVWRFMSRLAFLFQTAPAGDSERCLAIGGQLVDQLSADSAQDASRFEWALARLDAIERHLFEQVVRSAEPEIERLQRAADAADSASQPIDVGTMDTVPAELMPEPDAAPVSTATLKLFPADRIKAYLQGEWRMLQVLWRDPSGETWLLRDIGADRLWALGNGALHRLAEVKLAWLMKPRSLVRRAAERMLQAAEPPPA